MTERCNLDLPKNTKGMILSTEDKIMSILFREKSCTKGELKRQSGVEFPVVLLTLEKMSLKGYVVERNYENQPTYYLTGAGVYELEYRFNRDYFLGLHFGLEKIGYDRNNVERFLKNRFYNLYIAGEWNETTLPFQYKNWCESNNIELYSQQENTLKLK